MTLAERLDRMRHGIAGCELASFGDLRTGMALRSSAARPFKQDVLEELLRQAALHFEASDSVSGGAGHSMILTTPRDVRIFVRSPETPSDVVCCLCAGAASAGQVAEHADAIFRAMSGAD